MCKMPAFVLLFLCFAGAAVSARVTAFYVSTSGSDSWSGTLPAPNRAGTDGPFATLVRARDAVRSLKAAGKYPKRGRVAVYIRGGIYRITETLRLGAEDSGKKDSPVVWRAHTGETVRFTGGIAVGGLRPVTDTAVLSRLDPAARGKGNRVMAGDPGFMDLKNHDYRLKRSSPAWKLGFKRIPVEKIGLYEDEYRRGLPPLP